MQRNNHARSRQNRQQLSSKGFPGYRSTPVLNSSTVKVNMNRMFPLRYIVITLDTPSGWPNAYWGDCKEGGTKFHTR